MKYQDKNKTFGNHVWTQTKQAKLKEQPKWPDIPLSSVTATSGKEMATPVQYSCLKNPKDRGAWWAVTHEVSQEWDTTQQLNSKNKQESG